MYESSTNFGKTPRPSGRYGRGRRVAIGGRGAVQGHAVLHAVDGFADEEPPGVDGYGMTRGAPNGEGISFSAPEGWAAEAPRASALRASAWWGTRATRAAVQGRRGRAVAGGDARESGSERALKRGRLVRCAGGWRRSSVRTFSAVRGVENHTGRRGGFFASAR